MTSIGILGLGTYLPPTVRTNDWWPADIVARWTPRMASRATASDAPPPDTTPNARRTLAAMARYASDPFRGIRERRVIGPDMPVAEMETHAAREALARARVEPTEIGAIITYTALPDQLLLNNACVTHQRLGLPQRCIAIQTEVACNGFALQMSLAKGLIASGQASKVLLVQSCAITRAHGPDEPHSAWYGDGAAAAVIGPVSDGHGLLAAEHNADGSRCGALVLGAGPDKHWWEDGAITTYSLDREATRKMLFGLIDRGVAAVDAALARAGVAKQDVGFYATHQSTAWITHESAEAAGLGHVPTIVTFPFLGNMGAVNVPFILAMGEREGLIRPGTVVVTFSGGVGETWSSMVLRWGTGAP